MKKTIIGASTWALLPLLLLPWRTAGQEPVSLVVPDRLGIVVDTLAVLGDPEGPGILASENVYVTSDSRGHHFVFALPFPVIQEFDGEGRYVQTIGREGDGPGEFRWPQALHVDDAQWVHVADGAHQRVTRLAGDGSDPQTVSLSGLNPGFEPTAIAEDSLLLTGYALTPDRFGEPLHVLDVQRGVERSFGAPSGSIQGSDPVELLRSISRSSIWQAARSWPAGDCLGGTRDSSAITRWRGGDQPGEPVRGGPRPVVGAGTAEVREGRQGPPSLFILWKRLPGAGTDHDFVD